MPPIEGKIDVHHHFVPVPYREAMNQAGGDPSGWLVPEWTPERSEETLSELGAAVAILSVTAPGAVILEGQAAARLARECNEYAAQLRDKKPTRFGFFATLPSLLETDAAVEEIRYSLDELRADGVCVFTRYCDGQYYLGHSRFNPIWEELNARGAVVFTHPTHAVDTNVPNPKMPQPFVDYPHETTRTAMDMILSGTKRSFPNCKVILSHAGGTLPYLIHRASFMWPHFFWGLATQAQIEEDFRSLYFDLALSGTKNVLDVLLDLVLHDHILFGSDFPYAPVPTIMQMTQALEKYPMESSLRDAIYFENALKLFPRLQNA